MPILQHSKRRKISFGVRSSKKRILLALSALLGIFVVVNIALGVLYRDKVYPGYYLGTLSVGGMQYEQIAGMTQDDLLPRTTTFSYESKQVSKPTDTFGITVDRDASIAALKKVHSWLPLVDMFRHPHVALVTQTDDIRMENAIADVAAGFDKPALDKRVVFDGTFKVASPENGLRVDQALLQQRVATSVIKGKRTITVPATISKPEVHDTDLSGDIATLIKQTATAVKLVVGGQTIEPTLADKAGWYVSQGQTMVFSQEQTRVYLDELATKHGVAGANTDDLIVALQYSLTNQQANSLYLIAQSNLRVRTYCTAAKGVSEAGLAALNGKLAEVYADSRGWSNGMIAFKRVTTGCEFTVWLTAPAYMTSFGTICDDYYNCQVGSNVVVNNDRWQSATDPWNATGRGIEEYRSLIINHETGHRLGFRDNNITCSQPGQPAPVMMQQSIALNGCSFNAWPTSGELSTLKAQL